jgi:hypothetical protein
LTKLLFRLDDINIDNNPETRAYRRETIAEVQRVLQEKQSFPEQRCFEANNQEEVPPPTQVPSVKAKEPVAPHQENINPRDQSQVQSSLTEANILTLIEKLVDTQQGTGQVLQNLATSRQKPTVVISDIKNSISTFTGDGCAAQAEAWLQSVNHTATSLNMPVDSKLEFCTQHLRGAAKLLVWQN